MPRRGSNSELPPLSEATRGRPPRRSSLAAELAKTIGSTANPAQVRNKRRASAHGRGFKVAVEMLPALQAEERATKEREIRMRLRDVDTTYTQYFMRAEHTKAVLGLDVDTLQRDVRRVKEVMRAQNRFIIKTNSSFMQALDCCTVLALMFTATVTPYQISFINGDSGLVLLVCDRIVILIFTIGIVVSFLTPYREPLWKGGALVKDHRRIAVHYLRSWFAFDFISTLPLDELIVLFAGSISESNSTTLQLFRIVRLTRLVKLGRLARALRVVQRIAVLLEHKSELLNFSYTTRTLLQWMLLMMLTVHWFCCMWGVCAQMQYGQRTAKLYAGLADACRAQVDTSSTCLLPCELDALAVQVGEQRAFIQSREPWPCRMVTRGDFASGANATSSVDVYLYLLHSSGNFREARRPEENFLYYFVSYGTLIMRTLFIGAISGVRANSSPLLKAWQRRMDHLNMFLKEMNARPSLRDRCRKFLRDSYELELKRSFTNLYQSFSPRLGNEMRSVQTYSILGGVYFFVDCEHEYLRDLSPKLMYEAFERSEQIKHSEPTLYIVIEGTAVLGGRPLAAGQSWGFDVLIHSNSLRDDRIASALTFCQICCLSHDDLWEVARAYPASAKVLRFEALRLAIYRSQHMIAQYATVRGKERGSKNIIDDALRNLGENVPIEHSEAHTFLRSINGNVPLRGLATEQVQSADERLASRARTALQQEAELERKTRVSTPEKRTLMMTEDGAIDEAFDATAAVPPPLSSRAQIALASEVREMREDMRRVTAALEQQAVVLAGMQRISRLSHPRRQNVTKEGHQAESLAA